MLTLIDRIERHTKTTLLLIAVVLTLLIGLFDYASSTDLSLSAFDLLPVSLAAWCIGLRAGVAISVLSACTWVIAGLLAGDDDYRDILELSWNAGIQLASYIVVDWALAILRDLRSHLEQRVAKRSLALNQENSAHVPLQGDILAISEREQTRCGQDLQDRVPQPP